MSEKEYGIVVGQRGSGSSDPIGEIIRRDMASRDKKKQDREEEIEGLQHEATVKELKGKGKEPAAITIKPVEIDVNEGKKAAEERADKAAQDLKEERDKHRETERELEKERINSLRTEFTRQLDELKKLMEGKASDTQSISDKLAEVKTTAGELGWGPKQDGGAIPADINIRLQEQEHTFKLEIEKMKDERERKNREWELVLKKYGDEKEIQQQRLVQEASANAERTQLMRGGLDTLGRIMGKAIVEPGKEPGGSISHSGGAKDYPLEAEEGETGNFNCPGCGADLYLAPDASRVQCASCGAMSNFTRIPKVETPGPEELIKNEPASAI